MPYAINMAPPYRPFKSCLIAPTLVESSWKKNETIVLSGLNIESAVTPTPIVESLIGELLPSPNYIMSTEKETNTTKRFRGKSVLAEWYYDVESRLSRGSSSKLDATLESLSKRTGAGV